MTLDTPDAHVVFPLDVDEDGWPPVGAERVWAVPLGGDHYRIDNVPWFVRDLACDDVVVAIAPEEGQHPVYVRTHEKSSHLTIRVVCFRSGPLKGDLGAVADAFTRLGVYAEGVAQYGIVALDIPPTASLRPIYERLVAGQQDGTWEWEEGRINDAWVAAQKPAGRGFFRRG